MGRLPRQGEIWLGFTPGQPMDPHQPRPLLVVSEDVRNGARPDLIAVPIFSRGRLGPTRFPISAGVGGVPHDSVVFCEQIATVHRDFLVDGPLGPAVTRVVLDRVRRAVRRALGEVVPE